MTQWRKYTVEELVKLKILEKPLDGNHGEIHPSGNDFIVSGIPFIMASDIENGAINYACCKFISHKQAESLRKGFSKEGDVLLTHKATIGRTAIVGRLETPYIVLTPQVTYYRVKDKSKLDNRYLRFYFDSNEFHDLLNMWAGGGSTRAYLGITGQLKLPIILPPIEEQKRIADILSGFDDKIELNRKMCKTLEAMAQALFKSWFVDFEPVKAKIEAKAAGRDPELAAMSVISGKSEAELRSMPPKQYKELAHTASLFPDELVDSELGEIPKGWMYNTLANICVELRRGISPKYIDNGGTCVINQRCIREHLIDFSFAKRNNSKLRNTDGKLLQKGDLLINSTGVGTLGRMAQVIHLEEPTVTDSHVTVLRSNPSKYLPYTFAQAMLNMEALIEAMGHGSTGQTELSRENLANLCIVVPRREIQQIAEKTFQQIAEKISNNLDENKSLSILRGTLLPKLLSK